MSLNSELFKNDLKNFWRALSETVLGTLLFAIVCGTVFLIVWIFVAYPWKAIPFTIGILLGKMFMYLYKRYHA